MQEDSGFNFEQQVVGGQVGGEFKRERQRYLAERNARKMQAMKEIKRQRNSSSSSDGLKISPPAVKLVPNIKEVYLQKEQKEPSNTDSSNSPQEALLPKESNFQLEREKYKQQRMMRREEARLGKVAAFGSSSSEQKEVKIRPRASKPPQLIVPPQIKVERMPFREDDSPFALKSLQIEKGLRSAREPRQVKQPRGLLSSVRLKDKGSERKIARERYQVEVPSKKGVNVWLQRWLEFRQASLELADRSIPLYDIMKVKLILDPTPSGNFRIKLTLPKEEVFLAVSAKRINEVHYLDQYYFVFARIISLKLQLMGRRANPISRVREGLRAEILRQARLAGKVRKSSFFGSWQEKIGVVGNQGLALYKAGKDQAGMTVPAGGLKELWTRFEFQQQNLVIKFLNCSSKVELSVPCEDFLCRENWLYQIYSLANK